MKAHRDGADPKLEAEIRAFVKQEINHTREHIAFNRLAEDHGYDIKAIDKRVEELLALTKGRPAIANLAVTMALEHYTAMMAHEFLANPQHFETSDPEVSDMWRWHAVEEIEHKGVAYDTWNHATKGWSAWRRWRVRSLVMLIVTGRFFKNRWIDTMMLLEQDGITGWKARWGLFGYLAVTPGVIRRLPRLAVLFQARLPPVGPRRSRADREIRGRIQRRADAGRIGAHETKKGPASKCGAFFASHHGTRASGSMRGAIRDRARIHAIRLAARARLRPREFSGRLEPGLAQDLAGCRIVGEMAGDQPGVAEDSGARSITARAQPRWRNRAPNTSWRSSNRSRQRRPARRFG